MSTIARSAKGDVLANGPGDALTGLRSRQVLSRFAPSSLFWRVFLVNASLLVAGAVALAVSPATVSFPVKGYQVGQLVLGLVVILVANVILLRFSLRPLDDLARLMGRIDLLMPGERLEVEGARELAAVIGTFNQMLDRLELERRLSSARLVEGQEEERRRIAVELHDEVGQGLTALLLRLKDLGDDAPRGIAEQLSELRELTREKLDEVRRLARRLRPTVLDDLGLAYALLALLESFAGGSDVEFVPHVSLHVEGLPKAAELALYRIAQESLTNAVRHSGASRIELELAQLDDPPRVCLAVRDDGCGIANGAGSESGGLRAMRERAVSVNARLKIRSQPPAGTAVIAMVKLP